MLIELGGFFFVEFGKKFFSRGAVEIFGEPQNLTMLKKWPCQLLLAMVTRCARQNFVDIMVENF
jgi:hypothetical protein